MGQILAAIFQVVEDQEGLNGRIKLASATGISRDKAIHVEDEPHVVDFATQQATAIVGQDIEPFLKKILGSS